MKNCITLIWEYSYSNNLCAKKKMHPRLCIHANKKFVISVLQNNILPQIKWTLGPGKYASFHQVFVIISALYIKSSLYHNCLRLLHKDWVIQYVLQWQLFLWYSWLQRIRVRYMVGFLVQVRTRIMVRVTTRVGIRFCLVFVIGANVGS